jgi:hypothetical protein
VRRPNNSGLRDDRRGCECCRQNTEELLWPDASLTGMCCGCHAAWRASLKFGEYGPVEPGSHEPS